MNTRGNFMRQEIFVCVHHYLTHVHESMTSDRCHCFSRCLVRRTIGRSFFFLSRCRERDSWGRVGSREKRLRPAAGAEFFWARVQGAKGAPLAAAADHRYQVGPAKAEAHPRAQHGEFLFGALRRVFRERRWWRSISAIPSLSSW